MLNVNCSRMDEIQLPLIPVIGELIRQHPGTISLAQGVVSYPPPPETRDYLEKFFSHPNHHKYQAVQGIEPFLEVITQKLRIDNGIEVNQDNCIVVTAGGNMAFMNAVLAITEPGDEIILPTPYYFNHEMAIRMANCQPVLVPTDANYQLIPEAIAQAINAKTKAVVTISPNNPTGVVYPRTALATISQICREKGIYHISDEAYEYFTYDGVAHYSPASFAHSSQSTISLFSLSKSYGFASWRIGYLVIPQHLLLAVKKVQDTILICPPVISQYAAWGALARGKSYCQEQLGQIEQVRSIFLNNLQKISDLITFAPPEGAFYFFLKINSAIDSWELVERLVKEYQVAVIPGTTFGMEDGCYVRVSYGALNPGDAQEGIERLVVGLQNILF